MEEISIASKVLFSIGGWPITNSVFATWVAILVLIIIAVIVKLNIKAKPRGFQNFIEMVIEALLGLVDSVTGDRKKSMIVFPWIATFFLLILLTNWMELIPGFSALEAHIGHEKVSILRSASTDLNTTIAYALISVIAIQAVGISQVGVIKHVSKFINFKGPINFFVGILEIISEFAKIISFAFRLFGNIFAGEVLLVVITFLIPYIVPIPFYALELFVGLIQALVFSMLTLVFMTMAMSTEH